MSWRDIIVNLIQPRLLFNVYPRKITSNSRSCGVVNIRSAAVAAVQGGSVSLKGPQKDTEQAPRLLSFLGINHAQH